MKDTIHFRDLEAGLESGTLNDVNNPVFMACIASMDDAKDMTNFFREIGLIEQDAEVVNIQHILGNVRGEDGRYDLLLTITGKGIVNPIKRLQVRDLKWLSDFITNYRTDYNS